MHIQHCENGKYLGVTLNQREKNAKKIYWPLAWGQSLVGKLGKNNGFNISGSAIELSK